MPRPQKDRTQKKFRSPVSNFSVAFTCGPHSMWSELTSVKLKKRPTPPRIFRASDECWSIFSPQVRQDFFPTHGCGKRKQGVILSFFTFGYLNIHHPGYRSSSHINGPFTVHLRTKKNSSWTLYLLGQTISSCLKARVHFIFCILLRLAHGRVHTVYSTTDERGRTSSTRMRSTIAFLYSTRVV